MTMTSETSETSLKTILQTCDNWDTDYNSYNWEPEFMTIFVTWQSRVTLDSICNSCDVLLCHLVLLWNLFYNGIFFIVAIFYCGNFFIVAFFYCCNFSLWHFVSCGFFSCYIFFFVIFFFPFLPYFSGGIYPPNPIPSNLTKLE